MGDIQEGVKGTNYAAKEDVWDDIIRVFRRLLDYCLCCVTCGCYPLPEERLHGDMYEAELLEEERIAVENLLLYLDSNESKEPVINEERLRALCILTYSDNIELQRSAALCFAELSQRMKLPVSDIMLEPLVVLLKSRDTQIQKTSSLAVSNFALSVSENKEAMLRSGAVKPLIQLLRSSNVEVQCNTCGCITTLATRDKIKQEIVAAGGVKPLLQLTKSRDIRVQRNASGALLNLTHLQSNRNDLVTCGAIPVLVTSLFSADPDVQYYCAAALSNLAVNERHRAMMVAIGYHDMTKHCIKLLSSSKEKVKCQACLALRNLASDTDNQLLIVKLDCLPALRTVIKHSHSETVSAAMACLRNLSIHRQNETSIIAEGFLTELSRIVHDMSNPHAQMHAAGTIRNLSAGDHMQDIAESGCIKALLDMVMCAECSEQVLVEVTAALAVLADDDESRECILEYKEGGAFSHMISLASNHTNPDISYNCAGTIGQLSVGEISDVILAPNCEGLVVYLEKFLASEDPSLVHIALWTLLQLLKAPVFLQIYTSRGFHSTIQRVLSESYTSTIKELAQAVIEKTQS